MFITRCIWTTLVLGTCRTYSTWAFPAETAVNCQVPSPFKHLDVTEGHTGTLERVQLQLQPGESIALGSPLCPVCLSFLVLNPTPGGEFATVDITKPLDADAFNGTLTYSLLCLASGVDNTRSLIVKDINDNSPIFEKDVYEAEVPDLSVVDTVVVQVKATDADVSPEFNAITYTIEPPTQMFDVESDGSVLLKSQLNYTITSFYSFIINAKDPGGNSDYTTVKVNVIRALYFEYVIYNAIILENEGGPFQDISPAAIKAHNAYNSTVVYRISSVDPSQYGDHLIINRETGVITVQRMLDYERVNRLNVGIQASLENDNSKTADAMVVVEVKDVKESPVFSQHIYTAVINRAVPIGHPIVLVKATDPDVGQAEMLEYSLVESSSMFAVEPSSGQVYDASDIKENSKETVKVQATDPDGLDNTTTVEVTIVIDTSNVVKISINKPAETVINQVQETERALQVGLGLKVKLVNVTTSSSSSSRSSNSTSNSEHAKQFPRTGAVVSFVTMDTNGAIVPSDDVKTNLKNNEEKVQRELQEVFGPDTQFGIIEEEKGPGTDNTLIIVLATSMSIVIVGGILAGTWFARKRKKSPSTDGERLIDMEGTERKEGTENQGYADGDCPDETEMRGTRGSDESMGKPTDIKEGGKDSSREEPADAAPTERRGSDESMGKPPDIKEGGKDSSTEEPSGPAPTERRGSDESMGKPPDIKEGGKNSSTEEPSGPAPTQRRGSDESMGKPPDIKEGP